MIKAPIAEVFRALDDPESLPILYYCVCNVSDVTRSPSRIGDRFRGSFSVVGLKFGVSFTCTEHAPPSRIMMKFEGGVNGTMSYGLEEEQKSTRVQLDVEYDISGGLLSKIANMFLFEQMGTKNAERILENLGYLVEASMERTVTPPLEG